MFLKVHKIPYSTGSSVKDIIVNLTFITPARFHLEGVTRQVKKQKTKNKNKKQTNKKKTQPNQPTKQKNPLDS